MTGFGSNAGYVDDLYQLYLDDPSSVSEAWREFFEDYQPVGGRRESQSATPAASQPRDEKHTAAVATAIEEPPEKLVVTAEEDTAIPPETMRGPEARLVDNMVTSLSVPTATSVRNMAMKLLEENRRIINQYLGTTSRLKASFTHVIAYAIVRALAQHPGMNDTFEELEGQPHRVRHRGINLGLAIDIERRGKRMLVVPNIRDAQELDFLEFLTAYNDLVERGRTGKLGVDDFAETTVTITNPGMIGTVLSVPRLMAGQGTIIGIGAISYPAEFAGMSPQAIHNLGISRIMTVTSTYDHRVIQGAESGAFLATLERLLTGGDGFYEQIFDVLAVPCLPFEWSNDASVLTGGRRSGDMAKETHVHKLINAYRVRGHLVADLNPLGYEPHRHPELDLSFHDLSVWDLDREFVCHDLEGETGKRSLRSILEVLRRTYCGYVGAEYMFIADTDIKMWLKEQLERKETLAPLEPTQQLRVLEKLNAAEAFERFIHTSYVGHKRFSLEGCETLIPVLDALLNAAGDDGVEDVVFGMAHRGRLNVLVNTIGKSLDQVFKEFEDVDPDSTDGSGDVKYHLGTRGVHTTPSGKEVQLELASNPSHLESVDPVVLGMARARQFSLEAEVDRKTVLPILIHGDAAFAGQGVVAESLNMAQLYGYRVGGTVHVVVNNQIGFTTTSEAARSSHYATDIAKSVAAPILHVNADRPQAAVRTIQLAYAFRQKFQRDIVVDLICYRRWGHNEGDEPAYTQPVMYSRIRQLRSVRKLFTEQLLHHGDIDLSTAEEMLTDFQSRLDQAMKEARQLKSSQAKVSPLPDLEATEGAARPAIETGVDEDALSDVVDGLLDLPTHFEAHPKLLRQLQQRRRMLEEDRVDWALGESLAFGSLVLEGRHIRLSGEDSGRGTFSHRHAVLYDHRNGERYFPFQNLARNGDEQGDFRVYDSLLSEFAVVGFEYGYSIVRPDDLVMWEAQFGDFANGAQVIIDQYISSAEEKWSQTCSLVLLLPHGYEGQGPEHSSARLERYLQLCSEGNMRIAYPTTPAQYFHLLRRQALHEEKKPLIVMTPKSLLRLPAATSAASDFSSGSFREIIDDDVVDADSARRVLLTSGKVYYDLVQERSERDGEDIAIVRMEQYYPFAGAALSELLAEYGNASELYWVQEEPRNMGAWDFVRERFSTLGEARALHYVGRPWSASPATGSLARHRAEQQVILDEALA